MIYTIQNGHLKVEVSSRGAELQSIQTLDGCEYLWQGDPAYWQDRALNLFPYIARLTEGKYTLEGRTYEMPIHGFLNSAELEVETAEENRIVFVLRDSEETRRCYPYAFTYRLGYAVKDNRLEVTFLVENPNERTMYFGIGGHPGFFVPLEKGLAFEDYYLEFAGENLKTPTRVGFSETCFLNGADQAYPLTDGRRIPLAHSLFDEDAIVLTGMAKSVTLKTDRGTRSVTVTYPDMDYLGIWHMPHTDAPYVCIEPWSSLPSRQDVIEDLASQPGLVRLEAGRTYENRWWIEIR